MSQPQIYGLIGYPVKHSLSPAMHNAAFRSLNIPAEYRLFKVRPQDLEGFFKGLPEKNIRGLNVTVPHKERVISYLGGLSKEAELIGAVNTIKVEQGKLEGFNTDGEGFIKHLSLELDFNPEGKTIAIIGSGGAARAIAVCLSMRSPRSIALYDIDKEKARSLVSHLKEDFANNNIEFSAAPSIEALDIKDCQLLINATPIGMKESDPCLVDEKSIHKGLLVYDLIYNPKETKLLKVSKTRGAGVSNGLGMLLYQGVSAFRLWTGKEPPVDIMRKALTEENR